MKKVAEKCTFICFSCIYAADIMVKKQRRFFMDKYKLTFGIEPTDKYKKAKQDLIQALRSLQELSPQEQRVLAEEMFGIAQVAVAMDMFNKYLGR